MDLIRIYIYDCISSHAVSVYQYRTVYNYISQQCLHTVQETATVSTLVVVLEWMVACTVYRNAMSSKAR